MGNFSLSNKVTLDVTEGGKKVSSFDVIYREPTRKQMKVIGKENKEVLDLFSKNQKLNKRAEVLEGKLSALRELGKAEEVLSASNKLEKVYDEQTDVEDRFEELGGVDKLIEASKKSFDIAVSGKDLESLRKFTEEQSEYSTVLDALKKDAEGQQGKR